jgi:hypothetical protein
MLQGSLGVLPGIRQRHSGKKKNRHHTAARLQENVGDEGRQDPGTRARELFVRIMGYDVEPCRVDRETEPWL